MLKSKQKQIWILSTPYNKKQNNMITTINYDIMCAFPFAPTDET